MGRKEELAKRNLLDELIALRDEQRKKLGKSVLVVKGKELPWEQNRQGRMRWYLHPNLDDVALRSLIFYVQEIAPGSRSGKQKIQGGHVIYVWEGRGFTEIDGVRHQWEARDLINLPLLTDGIEVQHFNTDRTQRALLVSAQPNFTEMLGVDMGTGFEQLEDAPVPDDRAASASSGADGSERY